MVSSSFYRHLQQYSTKEYVGSKENPTHNPLLAAHRTRYSRARAGTKSYLQHHLRRVSKAAVIYDAMAIRKQITCLKQRAFGCAAHAAGADEVEA